MKLIQGVVAQGQENQFRPISMVLETEEEAKLWGR